MTSPRLALCAALILTAPLVFTGCDGATGTAPSPAAVVDIPETPDGTILAVATALANHQPRALWDALPPSYQTDVSDVLNLFANNMDPELYGKAFGVAQKLTGILQTKKSLILELQGDPDMGMLMMTDKQKLEDNWDTATALLETLTNSELSTLDGLNNLDIGTFLGSTGSDLMSQAQALSQGMNPESADEMEKLRNLQVELLDAAGDTATVLLTVPDEEPEEIELTRVDGRWVPTDMADEWDTAIADAKENLASMADNPNVEQQEDQALAVLNNLDSALDQLADAETAEQFKQGISGFMGAAMGAMMGGM